MVRTIKGDDTDEDTLNDGNDVIDAGDGAGALSVFGHGGNDKIIGGIGAGDQKLFGNDGHDKIWSVNPGQKQDATGAHLMYGGKGGDILYGSNG